MKVRDKVVIAAGASAGIGLGAARAFVLRGARVVVILARRLERLEKAADELKSLGKSAEIGFFSVDLSDKDAVKETANRIREKYGTPDILFHSSGAGGFYNVLDETHENMHIHMTHTYFALYNLVHEFKQDMLNNKNGGHIVIGGGTPVVNYPFPALGYIGSRSAIRGLAISLRESLFFSNVKVTYCEPPGISEGSSYFEDHPGVWERLPFAKLYPILKYLLYDSAENAGKKIVRAVERNSSYYTPLAFRINNYFPNSIFFRWFIRRLMHWTAAPSEKGGFTMPGRDS